MDKILSTITEPRTRRVAIPPENARQGSANPMRFVVKQDSMGPDIKVGDIVAVDTSITWWVNDGVYLLNFPGQGSVAPATQLLRRVIKIPLQDRYAIICDNPRYIREEVAGDILDIAGLAIEVFSHKLL